jgi:hypothetical protein
MSETDNGDIFMGTDEDGNKIELEIERYFFYNGEEYVLLAQHGEYGALAEEGAEAVGEMTLYVMRVIQSTDETGEETEEFVPVEESLMETLIQVVQTRFATDDPDMAEDSDDN